jgi:hypothetical protein
MSKLLDFYVASTKARLDLTALRRVRPTDYESIRLALHRIAIDL